MGSIWNELFVLYGRNYMEGTICTCDVICDMLTLPGIFDNHTLLYVLLNFSIVKHFSFNRIMCYKNLQEKISF